MPRIDRRRARAAALTAALTGGALVLAILTPGTSGAFTASVTNSGNTAATKTTFTCSDVFSTRTTSNAVFQYAFTSSGSSSSTATEPDATTSGTNTGNYVNQHAADTSTNYACPNDSPGNSWSLDGTAQYLYTSTKLASPSTFTIALWVKLTARQGRIIGMGDTQTGSLATYDRQIYFNNANPSLVTFGTYYGSGSPQYQTITAPDSSVNSTLTWHHLVATFAPASDSNPGMRLYIDGKLVASNAGYVNAQSYNGYWRIGAGSMGSGWSPSSNQYMKGSVRFAAVYTAAWSQTQVTSACTIGRPSNVSATTMPCS